MEVNEVQEQMKAVQRMQEYIEEAEKALQELGEKYPNNKDVVIFIEDITE